MIPNTLNPEEEFPNPEEEFLLGIGSVGYHRSRGVQGISI
jgi:hypothetical protein